MRLLLKTERLLELSLQKVLSQLYVRWDIRSINGNKSIDNNKYRAISDYISGMTDRYAIQLYKSHK